MEEIIQPVTEQVTDETPKEPIKEKKESKMIIWILLVIIFFLLAGMVYFYIKSNENVTQSEEGEKKTIEEESKTEDNDNENITLPEEKEEIIVNEPKVEDEDEEKDTTEGGEFGYNFPDGYIVSKESCNSENNLNSTDCVEVYKIQPDNYTALEKKYLLSASLAVFSKPNNVILQGQISQVRYDSQLKKWVLEENANGVLKVLPERIENSNIIVETNQGGSQQSLDFIIISKPNISSLLILSIPKYHRIVCNNIAENVMECEKFLASLNPEVDGTLPDSIYQTKYSNLKSSASTIW